MVKNLHAMKETQVPSLAWEDILEKEKATQYTQSTPVLWPGEFHGLYSSWGRKESDTIKGVLLCDFGQVIYLGCKLLNLWN